MIKFFLPFFLVGLFNFKVKCFADVDYGADLFFSEPHTLSIEVSPNAEHLALLVNELGSHKINIQNLSTQKETELLLINAISKRKGYANWFTWIDNSHLAIQIIEERKGIDNLIDTRYIRNLFIININTPSTIYTVRTKGRLIAPLPMQEGVFLYSKSGINSRMYKLSIAKLGLFNKKLGKLDKVDGGQFISSNEVTSVKGYVTHWFLNTQNRPVAALKRSASATVKLDTYNASEDTWKTIKTWDFNNIAKNEAANEQEKLFVPRAISHDPNIYFCIDLNEKRHQSIYKVNFENDTFEKVYQTQNYEILNILVHEKTGELYGVATLDRGQVVFEYITQTPSPIAKATDRLPKIFQPKASRIVSSISSDLHNKKLIMYVEAHNSSGTFYLYDTSNSKYKQIASINNKIPTKLDSKLISDTVQSHDLSIPYLLSLPSGKNHKAKKPLIVMPHGGPIGVFDNQYYDAISQFFTANDFAVLRVNYRGSSGYSEAFEEAGKREWGKKILDDIHNATLHVQKRADINSERICIYGASYGGYAALMLSAYYPDVYRCAASLAGVTDLNLYLSSARTNAARRWLKEYVGNPEEEYEALKQLSPVYRAAEFSVPLFIAHGNKDEIVDSEHASRLKLMLEKHEKDFEWYLIEEQGHHFQDSDKIIDFYSRLLNFLNRSLI